MAPRYVLLVATLVACTKAGTSSDPVAQQQPSQPPPAFKAPADPPPAPAPPPVAAKITVTMTAATLADDCGGTPPTTAPKTAKQKSEKADDVDSRSMAKRRCEQSSMQLSVIAPAGAASELKVKKVELYDEKGALVGELTARSPTVWKDSAYQPWDQKIAAAQELSVSYALSQPNWSAVANRWNKTYVVKAVIVIGGADQTVQKDVHVSAPTSLPPNVKT